MIRWWKWGHEAALAAPTIPYLSSSVETSDLFSGLDRLRRMASDGTQEVFAFIEKQWWFVDVSAAHFFSLRLVSVAPVRLADILPRAEETVRMALTLEPENEEAKGLLRELLGDENCRRKEMSLQVCTR